jgi:oligoribonuclease
MSTERPQHQFLWIDLETTGLVPGAGRILEWAAVLAEDDRGGSFAPVHQYSSAVHYEPAEYLPGMSDRVRDMHTANGLLADVAASNTTLTESEAFLCELLDDLGAPQGGVSVAGASVHFDLAWIGCWMPKLRKRLSHRVFDVTTLTRCVRIYGPDIERAPRESHRALPDILATLEDARRCIAAMGWA